MAKVDFIRSRRHQLHEDWCLDVNPVSSQPNRLIADRQTPRMRGDGCASDPSAILLQHTTSTDQSQMSHQKHQHQRHTREGNYRLRQLVANLSFFGSSLVLGVCHKIISGINNGISLHPCKLSMRGPVKRPRKAPQNLSFHPFSGPQSGCIPHAD